MAKLIWDASGEKLYETGVEQAAIFVMNKDGSYGTGEAWNGLTNVTESPSGAEPTALYANNKKYGEVISNEELGGTIEAYMYPDSFKACNGETTIAKGVTVSQQSRKSFGMVYKTLIGNDTEGIKYGYKLNIIYGIRVSPSEKANPTVNESVEASTLSWEFSTTPVDVANCDPTSKVTITSTEVDAAKLAELEAKLYGSADSEPELLLPDAIAELIGTEATVEG